jgi:hypothetical protein
MNNLTELMDKIEKAREEVGSSLETDSYEVAYAKNRELDRLIEQYLDVVEEVSTTHHLPPPPFPTIE